MFVRVKTTPNSPRKYVQIVQSIRKGDKVRQKIVRHIGYALDDMELEQLKKLAESIKMKLEADAQQFLISPEELASIKKKNINRLEVSKEKEHRERYNVNLKDLIEEDRIVSGIHDVYGSLFDDLRYKYTFPNPARQEMVAKIFKDIVLARIANPKSKRATVDMLEEDFGVTIPLHKVYRMMDKLDDTAIERLKDITFKNTRDLYGGKIDVIFYDATTIYFESFTEDELRKCGYSKDLKFNQPQVLLALMVTRSGLPIGYSVYEGNKYEGHTLIPALKELREKYDIGKVIFVADSAMFNRDNLSGLERNGFEYIVGARLKNMSEEIKEQILNRENYKEIVAGYELGEFKYQAKRLIVSYKAKRARKDKLDRIKAIEKLKKKLARTNSQKEYLSNYGYKKYLKITGESKIELDEDKLEKESKWDGLHGIITNVKDLPDEEILSQYSNLWNVEESFRITKHDLKVRPVFHWSKRRVNAHIAISFAAYSLVRFMEYRVKLQYKKLSPEKIRQYLIRVQTSILYDKKRKIRYAFPSKISKEARKIYKIFRLERELTPYVIK